MRVNRRFADAVIEEVGDDSRRGVRAGLSLRAAAAIRERSAARCDGVPVLAHPVAEPRSRSASARGARRSCTACSATTCSGFHIQYHCNNFLDTVDRALESRVDYEHFAAWRGGRPTYVQPFPISIDPALWRGPAKAADQADGDHDRAPARWA